MCVEDPPGEEGLPFSLSLLLFDSFRRFSLTCPILLFFSGFYLVFCGFYLVLLDLTGFYLVLLVFTKFYWVLPSFPGFYLVLLGFT